MASHFYSIADHHICLSFAPSEHNGTRLVPSFEPFRTSGSEEPDDLLFTLHVDDGLRPLPRSERHRIRAFDTGNGDTIVDRTATGGYQFIIKDIEGRECCLVIADHGFRNCQCALNGTPGMRRFGLNNALMLVYAFAAARHNTILVHASLVRKDGYGYAFTAKSGTGKSTQVSMWLRFLPGCDLMNDDNPVIRIIGGTPYIYGSPWSGKTPCYRNTRARLGAVTRIDRDTTNFVEPLPPVEAFATLLTGSSSMKWDEEIYSAIGDTVTRVVESTPIYSLHCLPNREAAEVCYQAIGRKEQEIKEERGERREERVSAKAIEFRNDVFLPQVVEMINAGHTVTLPLRGFSMRPFLENERDNALLARPEKPHVGDAVLAEISPKHYVLHRIWRIDGDAVTLLGDGNLSPEHCRLQDIKATAVGFYRKGRTTPDLTSGRKWRIYSWWWMHLRPLRRYLLAFHRIILMKLCPKLV